MMRGTEDTDSCSGGRRLVFEARGLRGTAGLEEPGAGGLTSRCRSGLWMPQ
jgi:hypothetical protein